MIKPFLCGAVAALLVAISCSNEKGRYIDLRSGKEVTLEKDANGHLINVDTKKPVYIYVDTKTHDTIYGRTGEVINGHVLTSEDGRYWYDSDPERNVSVQRNSINGEYKMKVEKDGDIKIKTDSKKIKIDGKTGEKKVKKD
jgi:hypothetical protein